MWPVAAAIAGSTVGAGLALQLGTLSYRSPDEQHQPPPRQAWWLIPTTGLAWGWLAWHLGPAGWPGPAIWLPLSAALGWLSAVDLDVRRIPDRTTLPAAGWTMTVLTAHAITSGDPGQALTAVAIGAAAGLAAWLLHYTGRGALGFGDVKLIAVLSNSVAFIDPGLVLPAMLASCLAALIGALITRSREVAFGPSLAIGCILALGLPFH